MIFEKAIRKRQSPLPPMGHHEIDSRIVSGSPNFMLPQKVGELLFVEELAHWPEVIDLLVQWQQVPMDPVDVTAQEIVEGQPLGAKKFYAPEASDKPTLAERSQHHAIVLRFHDGHESLMRGRELFTKTYIVQQASQLVQQRQSTKDDQWLVTAPKTGEQKENIVPLLAYGCYAPSGCKLSDIQQTYASIGTDGKDTVVNLHTESSLRQTGIVSPMGGAINGWQYRFIDKGASQSLISDIMSHRIEVPITIGEVTKTYVSVAYRENSESEQLIYLIIKPKEEL